MPARAAMVPIPRPLFPTAIERGYVARLVRRASAARELLNERLLATLRQLAPEIEANGTRTDSADPLDLEMVIAAGLTVLAARRTDAEADPLASILRIIESARRAFSVAWEPNPEGLVSTGNQVALFTAKQVQRTFPSVNAIAVGRTPAEAAAIRAWGDENAALIKSIDSRYFDDIRDVITEAVRKGSQTSEITRVLRERFGVSKSRARLIARDQIGKLNAQITQEKQTRLGVTRYVWSTSHDERVRPTHRNLDGTIQDWATAPVSEKNGSRNHPGTSVLCRCVALPYFGDGEDDEPVPFTYPKLGPDRPTIYGSRENPLTREQGADLDRRLGRTL